MVLRKAVEIMSRFRWSIVACGLVVAVACSFEAARAIDKDPKQPAGGRTPAPVQPKQVVPVQPKQVAPTAPRQVAPAAPKQVQPQPAPKQVQPQPVPKAVVPSTQPQVGKSTGTPLQPFQPNKGGSTAPTGKQPAVGSSVPGTTGTAAGTKVNPQGTVGRPPLGNNPATVKPGGSTIPGAQKVETAKPSTGNPLPAGVGKVGTPPGGQGVNAGKGAGSPTGVVGGAAPGTKSSIGKPKISVETGAGRQTIGGKTGSLPFDPKGTVKLNPQPEPPGKPGTGAHGALSLEGREKTKPLGVSKNGILSLAPPKGAAAQKDGKVLQLTDQDKQAAARREEVLHGLFGSSKKGRTATILPLGTDDKQKTPPVDILPLGTDKDKKDGRNTATLMQFRERDNMRHELNKLKASPDLQAQLGLKHVSLDKVSGVHQERLAKHENFQHWQQSNVGQRLALKQQFELQRQGDLSRRMNLSNNLLNAGGWAQHRHHGVIAAGFTSSAFSVWYAGGGCYPTHAWCPAWSPWVDWSYWGTCPILYDPRPYYCIPIVYDPCVPWVYYDYPVWSPLPVVSCGTWIDVSPVVVTAGQDVQLLAVRFVDNGHSEQNLGSRYRVWVRNNSPVQILAPFSVQLLASNELTPTVELPQSGIVIPSMDIGETQVLDIRLPLAANRLGTTPEGHRVPFTYLHVLVDSHQQLPETFEDNNGSVLARKDILPVDPAAFSTDLTASTPEGLLTVAGEGFGPEPGQVIVSVYGQQVQAEIHGWYDLGIRFEVPNFELTQPVDAEVLVVRGDSAVSNPLTVRLAPRELIEEAATFPELPIPDPPQ